MSIPPQEHLMGCAISCIAYFKGLSYQDVLKIAPHDETNGYHPENVKKMLGWGQIYSNPNLTSMSRGIVLIKDAPYHCDIGHYIAWEKGEVLNPWLNYPQLPPIAGIDRRAYRDVILFIGFESINKETHQLPWQVCYNQRFPEWHPKSAPGGGR